MAEDVLNLLIFGLLACAIFLAAVVAMRRL